MDIKELEKKINGLKSLVKKQKKESSEADVLRGAKKRLKRAQRRKNTLVTKVAFVEAKGKKKEKAASK